MGCYPLLSCTHWEELSLDLAGLDPELISVVFVADPFGRFEPAELARCCNQGVIPFKQHYVIDLKESIERSACIHHRRNARRAARLVRIERIADPVTYLDDWCALYNTLVRRHAIRGLGAFSRRSFAAQMKVPGLVTFRAVEGNQTVGMLLWYVLGEIGYYHLGAYSDRGYELGASFALFWEAIQFFRGSLQWLSLGAGAGPGGAAADGLTRFKAGWTAHTRTAYLCRHVVNEAIYEELSRDHLATAGAYFPAYRAGEFTIGGRAA
jgi:hypothetical protein